MTIGPSQSDGSQLLQGPVRLPTRRELARGHALREAIRTHNSLCSSSRNRLKVNSDNPIMFKLAQSSTRAPVSLLLPRDARPSVSTEHLA